MVVERGIFIENGCQGLESGQLYFEKVETLKIFEQSRLTGFEWVKLVFRVT